MLCLPASRIRAIKSSTGSTTALTPENASGKPRPLGALKVAEAAQVFECHDVSFPPIDAGLHLSRKGGPNPRVDPTDPRRCGGVPADLVDTVRLCAHELVANVVKHVGDGAPFRLVLGADAYGVSVEVHDRDDVRHPVVREVDWEAVGGRGMQIVRECAPAWTSTASDFGKAVAFRVAY
ncbi:ATP-binding protein [Yinghuangia soli]|uniref:ATP-binding protein n=1 Tax=Yinghuangia soli TaxID=2908204 RepID=A0AA41U509_9ACTN|nr:ATP-binding protein [Yinghuangia soli]MCF2531392.1 ATP-binding protein [Yinghuangia soli]